MAYRYHRDGDALHGLADCVDPVEFADPVGPVDPAELADPMDLVEFADLGPLRPP